jgi:GNAT superfamily N-acetyltransferase
MTTLLEIVPLPVDGDGFVRRLSAGDVPAICRLFQGLDMASRYPRFAGARSDEAMTRHSYFVLAKAVFVLGVYVRDDLRGILEAHECAVRGGVAEVALVVEREWRRQGLGIAMVSAAMTWGRDHDIDVLSFVFSRHNWPMRRLLVSAGARIDISLDEIDAEIDILPSRASKGARRARWPGRQ